VRQVKGAKALPTLLAGIYGLTKTYKTSTYLFAPPELRPMCVLDTEHGAFMRLRLFTMTEEERQNLGVAEHIPEYAGPWMSEDIEFFYPGVDEDGNPNGKYFEDCMEFAMKVAPDFKLNVTDTLSKLSTEVLKQVTGYNYEGTDKVTKRLSIGKGAAQTVHPVMTDYGFAQDRIMEYISTLNDGPSHTLLISHERTGEIKEAEHTKRVLCGPRTVGTALLEIVPSVLDLVLRFENRLDRETKKNKAYIRSRNHNFYQAGDRSGLFKDGMELDPQAMWKKLLAMIEMSKEK
jgi:hypothetical protein